MCVGVVVNESLRRLSVQTRQRRLLHTPLTQRSTSEHPGGLCAFPHLVTRCTRERTSPILNASVESVPTTPLKCLTTAVQQKLASLELMLNTTGWVPPFARHSTNSFSKYEEARNAASAVIGFTLIGKTFGGVYSRILVNSWSLAAAVFEMDRQ